MNNATATVCCVALIVLAAFLFSGGPSLTEALVSTMLKTCTTKDTGQ